MTKIRALAVVVLLAMITLPLYSAKKIIKAPEPVEETVRLSGEDSALIASRLSASQNRVKYMIQQEIETADLIPQLKEAEKTFDALKSSTDIKDPLAVKDLLLVKLASLDDKIQDRISLHKRMNLFYQIMVVSGMLLIVLMIVYSIYMFSRRK